MTNGLEIFRQAELAYHLGRPQETFRLYQKAIKRILKQENVTAKHGMPVPPDFARETLALIWRNFAGFIRDPQLGFNEENSPEAFQLLNSFRPTEGKTFPEFEKRGEEGRLLLIAIQATTLATLGLIAWDKVDRATAAKRYKQALEVAGKYPPFLSPSSANASGLVRWVYDDLRSMRNNLAVIIQNDVTNAELLGTAAARKDTVTLPNTRIQGDGTVHMSDQVTFATSACYACGQRDVKLLVCSGCKKASYCDRDCQKNDWRKHRAQCKRERVAEETPADI